MTNNDTRKKIQDEALAKAAPYKRCGIAASMGIGKTLIGLRHMDQYLQKNPEASFLVVAPKKSILTEWQNESYKHDVSYLLEHITFCTYLSLEKQDLNYDVVYLDECHSLLYSHDFWLKTYTGNIFGMTGTPPKYETSEKGQMVNKYCPIVYTYVTDEAIEDNILNDYHIYIHPLTLNREKTMAMEQNGRKWYTSEQATYDYWTGRIDNAKSSKEKQIMQVMRMKAIMSFPSKEVYAKDLLTSIDEKCILFANTQEQADKMCLYSYHSNNPESERNLQDFKKGMITRLSCVLQLNEGVNIPNLKEGIIMHAYGNERKTSQRLGRLLRLNPTEKSTIHILCYVGTVDEKWVKDSLDNFDENKITWLKH
jgi:superfamily II DNA or RNA helicase